MWSKDNTVNEIEKNGDVKAVRRLLHGGKGKSIHIDIVTKKNRKKTPLNIK